MMNKTNNMEYLNLFENTDMLDGGDNFRCHYYHQAGPAKLICRSPYPMLFVLQGTLEMRFKYDFCTVPSGKLIAINANALTEYRVTQDTIVLTYHSPRRLELMLSQCSRVYEEPFSGLIPILPSLGVWIDQLLTEHIQGKVWIAEEAHEQRRALARIMMQDYPRRLLGELYVAFAACVVGDCESCRQEKLCID